MDNNVINEGVIADDRELLNIYDRRRIDDAAAMQAALCLILAGVFFAAHMFLPDIADPVFSRLAELTRSQDEIIGNPICFIEGLL